MYFQCHSMADIPSEFWKSVSLKRKNPSDSPKSAAACMVLGLLSKTFRLSSASYGFLNFRYKLCDNKWFDLTFLRISNFPPNDPLKNGVFSSSSTFWGCTKSCGSNSKLPKIEEAEWSRWSPGSRRHDGKINWKNGHIISLKFKPKFRPWF